MLPDQPTRLLQQAIFVDMDLGLLGAGADDGRLGANVHKALIHAQGGHIGYVDAAAF